MFKNINTASDWLIYDTARSTTNVASGGLFADLSSAESSAGDYGIFCDILSNGFKLRGDTATNDATNGPSNTIIYAAFAEHPFKYALARWLLNRTLQE